MLNTMSESLCESSVHLSYRLHAVIIHSGVQSFGHYYTYTRVPIGRRESDRSQRGYGSVAELHWHRFDDERVTRVDYSTVYADARGGREDLVRRAVSLKRHFGNR